MNRPLISIVLPIYNVEKYLEHCLNSLITQTYENIEIIAVDDGSTDGSSLICEQYARRDRRIRVIHKENGGLSDARNVGIDECSGEYLSFVDSDDYIERETIERLYDSLETANADMSICNINYVNEAGVCIEELNKKSPITSSTYLQSDIYTKLAEPGYWFFVTAWNKLYRRNLFDEIRFPKGKYHEDEFVIHHIVSRCETIVCLQERLYNYVQRQGSIMNSSFTVRNLDGIEAKLDRMALYLKIKMYSEALMIFDNIVDMLYIARLNLGGNDVPKIKQLNRMAYLQYKEIKEIASLSVKKKVKYALFFKKPRWYGMVVKMLH